MKAEDMKTEEMMVLPCTRRSAKELVDGTLRVQIDVEPMYKRRFMELMGDIDIALAVAPLAYAPVTQAATEPARSAWNNLGLLAQSAVMLCRERKFQDFVAVKEGMRPEDVRESDASSFIKLHCGVESRKDIDNDPRARAFFADLMTEYRKWQR